MTSPEEIYQKAHRKYFKILTDHLKGDPFELELKVDKKYQGLTLALFREQIKALLTHSKAKRQFSYRVTLKSVSNKDLGSQDVPDRIYFESIDDFIKYLDKEKEFALFLDNARLLENKFPHLASWIYANPRKVVEYAENWDSIISVLTYLSTDFIPEKYFVRALPINLHTKFIERNRSIIEELLRIISPEQINNEGADFFQRLGFRTAENTVRFKLFDKVDFLDGEFSEISLPFSDFKRLDIQSMNIFIIENLTTFHTFPSINNSVVIWGKGYEVEILREAEWLKSKIIYYWGDMDTDGLAILDIVKNCFPQTIALFMSISDVVQYENWGVTHVDKKNRCLLKLSVKEIEAYNYLKKKNIRIEQERIPQNDLFETLVAVGLIEKPTV
jgi:hypothetical protein